MKRGLFIIMLFALCLHFNQARAQRYLPDMKGLQVTAGMADGVDWKDKKGFPYHGRAADSGYTNKTNPRVNSGGDTHKK